MWGLINTSRPPDPHHCCSVYHAWTEITLGLSSENLVMLILTLLSAQSLSAQGGNHRTGAVHLAIFVVFLLLQPFPDFTSTLLRSSGRRAS